MPKFLFEFLYGAALYLPKVHRGDLELRAGYLQPVRAPAGRGLEDSLREAQDHLCELSARLFIFRKFTEVILSFAQAIFKTASGRCADGLYGSQCSSQVRMTSRSRSLRPAIAIRAVICPGVSG